MKTNANFKTPPTLSFSLFLILLAVTVLSMVSCSKGSGDVSASAYVMAVNSAQVSSPQDFYVDNTKKNVTALAYTQNTSYITVSSGSHAGQFETSSSSTVTTSFTFTTAPGGFYSVFYTDGNTSATYSNDPTLPQSGNVRVRFINLSSAYTSNVDFAGSTGATIVSGLAYKTASAYQEVAAASTFKLMASGTSTVLLNIPVALQVGHIYTIFISGSTSGNYYLHFSSGKLNLLIHIVDRLPGSLVEIENSLIQYAITIQPQLKPGLNCLEKSIYFFATGFIACAMAGFAAFFAGATWALLPVAPLWPLQGCACTFPNNIAPMAIKQTIFFMIMGL